MKRLFSGLSDGRYHIPHDGRPVSATQRISAAILATVVGSLSAIYLVSWWAS